MRTNRNIRQSADERELVQAMGAYLRLVLKDLRSQFSCLQAEADQLRKSGVAASEIYKKVSKLWKEVNSNNEKSNTDSRL